MNKTILTCILLQHIFDRATNVRLSAARNSPQQILFILVKVAFTKHFLQPQLFSISIRLCHRWGKKSQKVLEKLENQQDADPFMGCLEKKIGTHQCHI